MWRRPEVGVAVMSLHTYVADRDELLDLMLDPVYAQMPRDTVADPSWRARVTAVAEANRALFREHPWAAQISTLRPPLGPGQLANTSTSWPRSTAAAWTT